MRRAYLYGILLIGFCLVSLPLSAQKHPNWNILSQVYFDTPIGISRSYKPPQPKFGDAVLVLEGEEIELDGYIYPLESKEASQHFILSSNPLSDCYFCGNAGPETVIEVHSKFLIPYSRNPIKLRGTFRINHEDPTGILYELIHAEEVQ